MIIKGILQILVIKTRGEMGLHGGKLLGKIKVWTFDKYLNLGDNVKESKDFWQILENLRNTEKY